MKQRAHLAVLRLITPWFLDDLQVSRLRCHSRPVAIEEGWGGRPIQFFPPYRFFRRSLDGDDEEARRGMAKWYFERMVDRRLFAVPKSEGGMQGGSLVRSVIAAHEAAGRTLDAEFSALDLDVTMEAIDRRVDERFDLLDSIREEGLKEVGRYIYIVQNGEQLNIFKGHHRTAAAAACGHERIRVACRWSRLLRQVERISKRIQE